MWTQASRSVKFLSALALVLSLARFDGIIRDQAPPGSVDAYLAQRIAKFHVPRPVVANDETRTGLNGETCGTTRLNLRAHEKAGDQIVSVTSIAARMRRLHAEIHAEQVFRHGVAKRPGFLSGRLVRTIDGRLAGLEEGREGN